MHGERVLLSILGWNTVCICDIIGTQIIGWSFIWENIMNMAFINPTDYDSYKAMPFDNYQNDSSNKMFFIGGRYLSLKFRGGLSMLVCASGIEAMNWECMYFMSITDYLLAMVITSLIIWYILLEKNI